MKHAHWIHMVTTLATVALTATAQARTQTLAQPRTCLALFDGSQDQLIVTKLAQPLTRISVTADSLDAIQEKNFSTYWASVIDALGSSPNDPKIGREQMENWLLSQFFFDRIELTASSNREFADINAHWDVDGEASPFTTFKKTFHQKILLGPESKPVPFLSADYLLNLQRSLLSGKPDLTDLKNGDIALFDLVKSRVLFKWKNVEGTKTNDLGRFRISPVWFQLAVPKKSKAPRALANPYMRSERDGKLDKFYYAAPEKIASLLDEAIALHEKQIMSAKTLDQRVAAHAEFVWRFMSIHPFVNGNGRTGRAVLAKLLAEEGLLPPLFKNQNDVVNSIETYVESVRDGVVLSKMLVNDVLWRSQNGWEPTESVVPLIARLPSRIYFDTEQDRVGKTFFKIDPYDFAQFLRLRERDDQRDETALLKAYVGKVRTWSSVREQTGEPYQVKYVPSEISRTVFQIDAANKEKWQTKSDLFYSDELMWRGLSYEKPFSTEDLLQMFIEPSSAMLSMNSSGESGAAAAHRVSKDFERFNDSLKVPKTFFAMSSDHMNAEGGYATSPFLSAAMNRQVADRFSKGFMMSKSSIMKQKGRLVIAAKRPNFGISFFNRLHAIAERMGIEFVSKYPRQMEVAVVGAIVPDSVMHIEYQDVKVKEAVENTGEMIAGESDIKTLKIFDRDPKRPSVITLTESDPQTLEVRKTTKYEIIVNELGHASIQKIKTY